MFSPILRQLDFANVLTLIGLGFSFFSAIFAIQGQFYVALICMMSAGIIDLFDGLVARKTMRTDLQAEVGKHLDSIVDVCSFGFAPAIFAYCYGLNDPISITLLVFYVLANALRLAYFNTTGLVTNVGEDYFTGLPVTYSALFIPLIFTASFLLPVQVMKILLDGLYLLLASAMVANFKMIKLRGIWYWIFSLGALMLAGIYSWAIIQGGPV
jgi:CDP-diacylglycerol--serine O-phosphatidyltransferase